MSSVIKNCFYVVLGFVLAGSVAKANTPEQFKFKVTAKMAKLTQDLKHPGGVNIDYAPGSDAEIVTLSLSKDCSVWAGAEHCGGRWQKSLSIEGIRYVFYASVYNQSDSTQHTIVLNVCLSGEEDIAQCAKYIASQVSFLGNEVPELEIYDSSHWNKDPSAPASYQPMFYISKAP